LLTAWMKALGQDSRLRLAKVWELVRQSDIRDFALRVFGTTGAPGLTATVASKTSGQKSIAEL